MVNMDKQEKLKHLALLIKNTPEDFINLSLWLQGNDKDGYVGNPGSLAALDPEFNSLGLTLKKDKILKQQLPQCKGYEGMSALEEFFELTKDEAEYLFEAASYHDVQEELKDLTREDVLSRIYTMLWKSRISS